MVTLHWVGDAGHGSDATDGVAAGATWAQLDAVKLLAGAGANVSVLNADNFTAGDLAACMVSCSSSAWQLFLD